MTPKQIQTELAKIARTKLKFTGDLNAGELGDKLDSVQQLTLVVAIEDHFEICLDPEDEAQIVDIADLIHLISSKLAQK
jgi:acyl carrier protein